MTTSSIPFTTLLVRLNDHDSQVRRQTIRTIMSRPNERGLAFPALLALLNDPVIQVRKATINALGTLGDPQALPALDPPTEPPDRSDPARGAQNAGAVGRSDHPPSSVHRPARPGTVHP
jgi:hypothetical protein